MNGLSCRLTLTLENDILLVIFLPQCLPNSFGTFSSSIQPIHSTHDLHNSIRVHVNTVRNGMRFEFTYQTHFTCRTHTRTHRQKKEIHCTRNYLLINGSTQSSSNCHLRSRPRGDSHACSFFAETLTLKCFCSVQNNCRRRHTHRARVPGPV